MAKPTKLHVAARLEDLVNRGLGALFQRHGWTARITASTGYGTPHLVHVFARALLSPPAISATSRTSSEAPHRTPRGWRSLMALPAVGRQVRLQLGSSTHVLQSDRGGYVHASIETNLSPGWHNATIEVDGRDAVTFRIRVADPAATAGVVCDVDDTILVTWLPRPLLAAWNSLFLREHARRPVPGMSRLLSSLAGEDALLVYLSTGAWNFAPHLERFMAEHGFPAGPLILTDWGPTETGWFRSGAAHKRAILERLRTEHPNTRWTLVGDDGQRDPSIYAAFAADHPEAVRAIAIRELTPAQQLLATAQPIERSPTTGTTASVVTAPVAAVSVVHGADGFELLAKLTAAR